MLLCLFLAGVHSYFPFEAPVIEGRTENWVSEVSEYIEDGGICVVFFIQKRAPRCKAYFQEFQEAANRSEGLIKFISVDFKENPKVAHLYTVRAVPAFRLVNKKEAKQFASDVPPLSILEAALKLIPNRAHIIDYSWAPGSSTPMSAILFTNKQRIPPFWAGISVKYENSDRVRIGYSRDPKFSQIFGAEGGAISIIFVYREVVSVYSGALEYRTVLSELQKFIKDPRSTGVSVSVVTEMVDPTKFPSLCRDTGKVCVFQVGGKSVTEEYEAVAKVNQNGPFRFFWCPDKCPYEGMTEGYYAFHGKRDSVVTSKEADGLAVLLDRIVDGGIRWLPYDKVFDNKGDDI
jgi:hypothetical protein